MSVGFRSNDWCPYKKKRGHRETYTGRKAMTMEGEPGATSQGMPQNAELEEIRKDSSLKPLEGTCPHWPLTLDF